MAPNANESTVKPDVLSDEFGFQPDDVVITGFSGRLPECDSIDELKEKLYAGEDLVNGDPTRWPTGELKLQLIQKYISMLETKKLEFDFNFNHQFLMSSILFLV